MGAVTDRNPITSEGSSYVESYVQTAYMHS